MLHLLLKPLFIILFIGPTTNVTPTKNIIIEKSQYIEHKSNTRLISKKLKVKYKTTAAGWTFITD